MFALSASLKFEMADVKVQVVTPEIQEIRTEVQGHGPQGMLKTY